MEYSKIEVETNVLLIILIAYLNDTTLLYSALFKNRETIIHWAMNSKYSDIFFPHENRENY